MDVLVAVFGKPPRTGASLHKQATKKENPAEAGFSQYSSEQQSAKQLDHYPRCNRGTDNTGHVRTHCVHQQEVLRVGFQAHLVGDPRRHGHRGYTGGANQRVDRFLGELVHQFRHQYTGSGAHTESQNTQAQDTQRLAIQELVGHQLGANRQTQEDGYDVDQRVLCGIAQTLYHATLTHQVTEAEHTQQRSRIRQEQNHCNQHHQREDDLLFLAHRAQLAHLDLALLLGGQRLHDGRLDHWHQRHVGVGRYRNRTQKVWSQNTGYIDGRRAVSTTDDTDGSRFQNGEVQNAGPVQQGRTQNRTKDTELSRCTQQQGLGVGQQRAEVGHRAYTHEDQQRPNGAANNHGVEVIQHTVAVAVILGDGIGHGHFRVAGFLDRFLEDIFQLRGHRLAGLVGHVQGRRQGRQNLGTAIHQRKVDGIFRRSQGQPCLRNIRQDTAEPDGDQQQWLEFLVDRKIEEQQADGDHHYLAELDIEQATTCPQCHHFIHGMLALMRLSAFHHQRRRHPPP